MSTCRSCGAEVVWAVTTTGKRMPVDPEPVGGGNVALASWTSPPTAFVGPGIPDALSAAPRHTSHFATCPHAATHRKAR